MTPYQPFSPVDIRFATLQTFEELLSSMTDRRVLVMASIGTLNRLKAHEGINRFVEGKKNRLISDIRPNPSVEDIQRHLKILRREEKYDCILAVGGGSCIDLAKAVSALQGLARTHDPDYDELVEAIRQKSFLQAYEPSDIIAVPTTAGTGSEVTKWATIWDMKEGKKLSVDHPDGFPKAAIIVPELTVSMPQRLTLATGLDALSHAMEAFWGKKRNPLSQALSLDAIQRVQRSLPAVLQNPNDIKTREEMCMGSLLAGLAFSMTRTTACHSISYPLTIQYDIDHGFAAALTLAPMLKINAKAVPELSQVTRLFGGIGGFKEWLSNVTEGIQKLRLSAFGIREHMIDSIVEGAYTQGRMDNNPVPLEPESVRSILKTIL